LKAALDTAESNAKTPYETKKGEVDAAATQKETERK